MLKALPWLLGICLCALPARAEDDEARARRLFFEGHQAADAGDHARACARFGESVKLFRRVSTLLNLGTCNDAMGRLATALAYWREGAALLESTDPRFALAKARIADLEVRAPRVNFDTAALVDGAIVSIDGVPYDAIKLPTTFLDPGPHVVTVAAPGHATWRTSVAVVEGDKKALVLALGPAAENDSSDTQQMWGFIAGGVGIASIAVGAITGGLVLDKKATVEQHCDDADTCRDREGVDAAEAGRTLAIVSTATFITGGALLGLGLVLVLTTPSSDEPQVVALVTGPGDAGLGLLLRF